MPFKDRKTGLWVGKVVVGGKQYWCGSTHRTKTDARTAEDRKRLELSGARNRPGSTLCDEFALRWVDDYPRAKESTNRHNRERVRKFAEEFKGVELNDVSRVEARRWALMNPSHVSAVRAMFSDAKNDGLCSSNPFMGLRMTQSRGRRDIKVLSEKELHKLADCALKVHGSYGPEFRALILFAAYVGCRPGELIRLTRKDVRQGQVFISEQLNKFGDVTTPKNGQARVVICPPPAQEALESFPARDPRWLFLSKRGFRWDRSRTVSVPMPLSQGSLFYAWNAVRQAYGAPGLDFYEATRHFCATHLLELGVAHADVAVQLGHRDGGALVMKVYGHPSEDLARQRLMKAFEQVEVGKVVPLKSVERK
jgi:integrase